MSDKKDYTVVGSGNIIGSTVGNVTNSFNDKRDPARVDPGTAVYVAAGSCEIPRAQGVIKAIRAMGFRVTHDWTESVLKYGPLGAPPDTLRAEAENDMRGVLHADIFVLLVPAGPSTGAWAELGMAVARRMPVFISGKSHCIFSRLVSDSFQYATDAELLEEMRLQMACIDEAVLKARGRER